MHRLTFALQKPALPAKKSKAGERSRESAPVPATRPERIEDDDDDDFDDNDDDGTGAYKPTPPGEDSDSDASGHMSVDPEEQQVEEEVAADGTLVVKKCAEKDYTKIEKEVVGSAEFAETGKYNTARFLALTAEQVFHVIPAMRMCSETNQHHRKLTEKPRRTGTTSPRSTATFKTMMTTSMHTSRSLSPPT